jgi:hypothetical protein
MLRGLALIDELRLTLARSVWEKAGQLRRERGSDPGEGSTYRKRVVLRRKHGAEMDYECGCVRWGKLCDHAGCPGHGQLRVTGADEGEKETRRRRRT